MDDETAGRGCEGSLRGLEAGFGGSLSAAAGNVREGSRSAVSPRCVQPVPVESVLESLCGRPVFEIIVAGRIEQSVRPVCLWLKIQARAQWRGPIFLRRKLCQNFKVNASLTNTPKIMWLRLRKSSRYCARCAKQIGFRAGSIV